MGKCTERSSRAVASLLYIVTLGRLVDLWMKLLLCSRVAVATRLALITVVGRVTPLVIQLHVRTRCGAAHVYVMLWV